MIAYELTRLGGGESHTKTKRRSILQDWVTGLQLREQGTLLTVVRGCDLVPKYPLDSPERQLVAYIRGCFLVPADEHEVDKENGSFMSRKPPVDFRPSCVGHYPLHWVMHIVHSLEVIGYRHPDLRASAICLRLYHDFCHSFHLYSESLEEMEARLGEDRIANGTVVL